AAQCHLLHRTAGHETPQELADSSALKCSASTGSGKDYFTSGPKKTNHKNGILKGMEKKPQSPILGRYFTKKYIQKTALAGDMLNVIRLALRTFEQPH
ncbi:hypothetical protein CEXT_8011, partial [Caerostris extrusa]